MKNDIPVFTHHDIQTMFFSILKLALLMASRTIAKYYSNTESGVHLYDVFFMSCSFYESALKHPSLIFLPTRCN